MNGVCRFCGQQNEGNDFHKWVKSTFTDHDKLLPGSIICNDCLFWFEEKSTELAAKMDKNKPQRMRNYSHFIINETWTPLSKGDKSTMTKLLLSTPFPELAAIAESGQKHIVFRATRNPQGGKAGWVQFEEQSLWLEPDDLRQTLDAVEPALSTFSKGEIESGNYLPHRIMAYGLDAWQELEAIVKLLRGGLFFNLAIFLAQKREDNDNEGDSSRLAGNRVAGNRQRIQKSLSADDLGAIREHREGGSVHQQSRQVHQLGLFETVSRDTSQDDGTG